MARSLLFSSLFVAVFVAGCAAGTAPDAIAVEHHGDAIAHDETETASDLFDADPYGDAPVDTTPRDTGSDSGLGAGEASVDVVVEAAPIDTAPPDRCAAKSDGAFCASRFSSGGLDVHDLVHCKSGATTTIDTCIAGCVDGSTGADSCHFDPCTTAKYGGLYCGQSTQESFGGGIVDWLYDCEGGATKSSVPCAKGCVVEPAGTEDECL